MMPILYAILLCAAFLWPAADALCQKREENVKDTLLLLCRTWKLVELEEFGERFAPGPEQEKDGFTFLPENTFRMTRSGKTLSGKWSETAGKITLGITSVQSGVNWIRLEHLAADELRITFQSADLVKTTMLCAPVKGER